MLYEKALRIIKTGKCSTYTPYTVKCVQHKMEIISLIFKNIYRYSDRKRILCGRKRLQHTYVSKLKEDRYLNDDGRKNRYSGDWLNKMNYYRES